MALWECKYNYCWLNNISITQNVDLALTSEENKLCSIKTSGHITCILPLIKCKPEKKYLYSELRDIRYVKQYPPWQKINENQINYTIFISILG